MTRLLLIPLAVFLLLCGALAWSGGRDSEDADFTFINRGDIKTLDPRRMSWAQDIRVGLALWEGLYSFDPRTLDPIPGSAHKVELSDDKLVYTFHIRPEAAWSNGDPLRAADFVWGWRRLLEQTGDYTYLLFYIKGARAYSEAFAKAETPARRPDFGTVGMAALDDKTLRVTLEHPVAFFADLCAFPTYFPQHERSMEPFKTVDRATGRVVYDGRFTRPPNLVTNGPYRLDSWAFKGTLRMIANDHYWDRANVRSEVIDQVYAVGQVAYEMYEKGEVDWHAGIELTPVLAANLRQRGRPDLHVGKGFGTYFYSFNCQPKLPDGSDNPLADVRVRRALSMALNKQPVVEFVTRMGEATTENYVPPGVFGGYKSPPGLPPDVDAARRLLAEAGYPDGKGFPKLAILFNNDAHHGEVAQIVRRQWLERLGIDLTLEGVEGKVFGERLHTQQYAIARASWIGDYNDVSTFTDKYLSVSENNDSKWANPAYDKLCADAAVEPDAARRLVMLAEAEALLLQEAPILPVYSYVNVSLYRDNVEGIYENPKNMIQFKAVKVRGK
jgi:oligopeptide transport system substrate-binding protein